MPQVELPDGSIASFPDEMPSDQIEAVIKSHLQGQAVPQAQSDWRTMLTQALMPRQTAATTSDVLNTPVGGFFRGLRDPLDQLAGLAARGFQAVAPQSIQPFAQGQAADTANAIKQAEQDYTQNWRQGAPPAFDVGRLAGNIAAMAPVSAAMPGAGASSLAARMASGAGTGAISGALQPVAPDREDFFRQTLNNALLGGVTGAAIPAVIGGAARIVSPNTSPDVQAMMDLGVRPTPGQALGGTVNRAEQALMSVPGPGDVIKNARRNTVLEFDRGVINKALSPIGEKLESPGLGREAIGEMQDKVSAAYDALVPQLGIQASSPAAAQLQNELNRIAQAARYMPESNAKQLQNIIQGEVLDKLSPAGGMTGQSFQEAKSALGRLASDNLNSSNAGDRQLGGALLQAQVSLRDALRSANPDRAAELGALDNAFAQSLRVNNAAARVGGEPGIFTPAQLQGAARALDPSLRKKAFAAGDALMQDVAEAGKSVLGNTVPDSGTPYRAMLGMLAGAATGGAVGIPYSVPTALGAAGLTGATSLAYSPWGRWLLSHAFASRPTGAVAVSDALRGAAPALSAAPAPVFGALGF